MTTAMRAMRSAACWRILALLLLRRHLMVPQIWGQVRLGPHLQAVDHSAKAIQHHIGIVADLRSRS